MVKSHNIVLRIVYCVGHDIWYTIQVLYQDGKRKSLKSLIHLKRSCNSRPEPKGLLLSSLWVIFEKLLRNVIYYILLELMIWLKGALLEAGLNLNNLAQCKDLVDLKATNLKHQFGVI